MANPCRHSRAGGNPSLMDRQSPKNQSTEIHKRIPACAGMTAVMYPVFIVLFAIRPFSDDLL